jgi:hypothetical protein
MKYPKEIEIRILEFVESKIIPKLEIGTEDKVVKNGYSGVTSTLNPTQFALYNLILNTESLYIYAQRGNDVAFAQAILKDYFEAKWPEEFKILTSNCPWYIWDGKNLKRKKNRRKTKLS